MRRLSLRFSNRLCPLMAVLGLVVTSVLPYFYQKAQANPMSFQLTSSAFQPNGPMPARLTCEGADLSPPLAWRDIPAGTQSLALVISDPDAPDPAAPRMTWVHWVLFNIPPDTTFLAEAASAALPPGMQSGLNDWKRTGYGGPCPPIGRHRYIHELYALDTRLEFPKPPTKAGLEHAMRGHILAQATLIGTYQKAK